MNPTQPNAIQDAFASLERAGIRPPFSSPDEARATANVWRKTLGAVPPEALDAAITAWLQSDKGQWWPKPAELRRLLPQQPARPERVETGWLGAKVAAIRDGARRIAVIEQALAQVAEAPPCGKERCGAECARCLDAALRKADELAVAHG